MMGKMNFDRMLTISLVVALVIGGSLTLRQYVSGSGHKTAATAALPEATFYDALGQPHTLADWQGRVVLVTLWATWCPPCVVEMPSLDRLQGRLKGKGLKVVAIAMDQTPLSTITAFLEQKDITQLEAYWDQDRQIPLKWKYAGLPVSFLIGKDGKVIQQFDGPQTWDTGPVFDKIDGLLK